MIYVLTILIVLLLIIVYRNYQVKKKIDKDLQYISNKITSIIEKQSSERLLLITEEQSIRDLLTRINSLLDYYQEFIADNARIRLSMNRMLSNISHDLKTPLTVILGYIETIQQNEQFTQEEKDVLLSKMHEKVIEVTGLINRFFDLAKLESGDRKLDMGKVLINEVCGRTILGYYDALTSKGFDVKIDIPEDPIFLYADAEAITRILNNLISNAIKYGRDGNVIGLTLRQTNEHVLIEIWDKGKGIKETDTNKIFERLYTLDDSRSSSAGSGLGLTIAKRLTEQMKGQIEFSSIPYQRTVFTIKFKKL